MNTDFDLLTRWCILKKFEISLEVPKEILNTWQLRFTHKPKYITTIEKVTQFGKCKASIFTKDKELVPIEYGFWNISEAFTFILQRSLDHYWGYSDINSEDQWVKFPQSREELQILLDLNGVKSI